MKVFIVLALFLAAVLGQSYKCDLQYRSGPMRNGIVNGVFRYSWQHGSIKVELNATPRRDAYQEIYQFNKQLDNGHQAAASNPFFNQYVFRKGATCNCEVGRGDFSMPLLTNAVDAYPISTYYTEGATSNGCTTYTLNPDASPSQAVKSFSLNKGTGFPCQATWQGSPPSFTWTFSNCVSTAFVEDDFKAPTGCKCGKPMDLVIVLDRSSSIDRNEFFYQKLFVTGFTSQFEYGQLASFLSVVNFNKNAWIDLPLLVGVSNGNVAAYGNSLGCPIACDNDKDKMIGGKLGRCRADDNSTCCCCCGTSISSGIDMGADELFRSGRPYATPMILVVTDGYHNTDSNGNNCPNDNGVTCNNDLKNSVSRAYAKLGSKTIIYAVGVGDDRMVSYDQLLMVANNRSERVLRVNDFEELARFALEVTARTCDEQSTPCAGCCGFCVCGTCQPPDTCEQTDICETSAIPAVGVCCTGTSVVCETPNPCATYQCLPGIGCNQTSYRQCPPHTRPDCFSRACNPATGDCETTSLNCGTVTKECTEDTEGADCDDNNACTIEKCKPDFTCEWNAVNCTDVLTGQNVNPNDKCAVVSCDPLTGCKSTSKLIANPNMCDDQNNCTRDFCDADLGCVNQNVSSECVDDDPCTDNICHPQLGCIFLPKVCPSSTENDTLCFIGYCGEDGACLGREVPCFYVPELGVQEEVIVGVGLGAGAIVGIVIGIAAFAAGSGAGINALVQGGGVGSIAATSNNPLFDGGQQQYVNPIHRA